MSQPVKMDFKNILREYVNIHPRLSANNFQGVNLDNVSIHLRHYSDLTDPENASLMSEPVKEVAVDNAQAGPELTTETRLENDVQFEIFQGYCEDFPHKEVNFALPNGHGKVKVRLNSGKQTVSPKEVKVTLSSSSGNGAKAMVTTKTDEKAVTFLSKVYLRGKVLFNHGSGNFPTQNIIEELKERNSSCVKDFQRDRDGFYWIIEGICKMKIGVLHGHNWS